MTTTTTPKTDLEIYQSLRIEALERELAKAKELLKSIHDDIIAMDVEFIELKAV